MITTPFLNSVIPGSMSGAELPKFHVYSILDFDKNGANGGTLTIRNPWGHADNTTGGTFQMSLEKYCKEFSELMVEK